mmetsp:Transcript_64364/g.167380  ORF Transcript_64364/g.167380 Transcript_64364/m.167380 type:complete len:279 (+) Transcript_64364:965-1801(+)
MVSWLPCRWIHSAAGVALQLHEACGRPHRLPRVLHQISGEGVVAPEVCAPAAPGRVPPRPRDHVREPDDLCANALPAGNPGPLDARDRVHAARHLWSAEAHERPRERHERVPDYQPAHQAWQAPVPDGEGDPGCRRLGAGLPAIRRGQHAEGDGPHLEDHQQAARRRRWHDARHLLGRPPRAAPVLLVLPGVRLGQPAAQHQLRRRGDHEPGLPVQPQQLEVLRRLHRLPFRVLLVQLLLEVPPGQEGPQETERVPGPRHAAVVLHGGRHHATCVGRP